MTLSSDVERALDACYDSIAVPGQWTSALDELAHALGAKACMVLPHDVNDRERGIVGSTNMQSIHELWQRNLDWVKPVYEPRGDPFVRQGYEAVLQSDLFTDEEIVHSRFHQEILVRAGLQQWACGIFTADGRYWCMPFFRGADPFAPDMLESLAEVARRMARIVSISGKMSCSAAENEVLTLERMGCAAVLVDRHGRVARANGCAEELFCNEFGVRHGRLWATPNANLARLDRFMAQIEHAELEGSQFPAPLVICREGLPWLLIEAMPVTAASIEIFEGRRAILIISDVTRPSFRDTALLVLAFGLTAAEARLAKALCDGQDITTAAVNFGISPQTARSQLKTVFAKTGARRQAELVAWLTRIRSVRRDGAPSRV